MAQTCVHRLDGQPGGKLVGPVRFRSPYRRTFSELTDFEQVVDETVFYD